MFETFSFISVLFQSKAFLAAFLTWFVAQLSKAVIHAFLKKHGRWWRTFFLKTGGMPSSHSALVTAVSVMFIFEYGFISPLSIMTYFYGLIVIRDAFGVRRSVGFLVEQLSKIDTASEQHSDYQSSHKYVQGHTPFEVIIGVIIGLCISVSVYILLP